MLYMLQLRSHLLGHNKIFEDMWVKQTYETERLPKSLKLNLNKLRINKLIVLTALNICFMGQLSNDNADKVLACLILIKKA